MAKQRAFIHEHGQGIVAVNDFSTIFSFGEPTKKGSNIVPLLPVQSRTREWLKKQKVSPSPSPCLFFFVYFLSLSALSLEL